MQKTVTTTVKQIKIGWKSSTKFKVPIPKNEKERLRSLHKCMVLDTPPEDKFNDITVLASHICDTPIALISLVDTNRQWFKSKVGMLTSETPRDIAFCAHAIMQKDVFVVPDAIQDPRFKNNPLVVSDPKIRFYAGATLITSGHHALGTLCVADYRPRDLSSKQLAALKLLSRQVVALIELRQQCIELKEQLAGLKQ